MFKSNSINFLIKMALKYSDSINWPDVFHFVIFYLFFPTHLNEFTVAGKTESMFAKFYFFAYRFPIGKCVEIRKDYVVAFLKGYLMI